MDKIEKKQKEFVGYEYKEVIAESSKASFLIDGYEYFGWKLDEKMNGNIYRKMKCERKKKKWLSHYSLQSMLDPMKWK